MRRVQFPILILLCVVFYACKDNVVCPAFQSTYILNDSIRMARYSLFLNDSTPKIAMVPQRTKFGVSKKVNKYRKAYDLMTVPKMNELGPPARDSLYYFDEFEEGDFLASDFVDMDTLGVDSVSASPMLAAIEKPKDEKEYKFRYHPKNPYNTEQEYYNKYYGDLFVDERPTVAAMLAGKDFAQPPLDTAAVERKGLKGLFGKRKNANNTTNNIVEEEEPEETEEVVPDGNELIEVEGDEEVVSEPLDSDTEPENTEEPIDDQEPEVQEDSQD